MEIDTPKKPCVVHLPAELKMFREPNGNQLPKEVPSMIRQPQSWNPKDPKENKTNNVKTIGVVQNHLKSKYWTKEETKTHDYPIQGKNPRCAEAIPRTSRKISTHD